jgi:hypothetical protein
LWSLQFEAEALVEGFGLEPVTLTPVVPPALRPKVGQAERIVGGVGFWWSRPLPDTDHGTGRRTYQEIAETEGYALLQRRAQE